MSETPRTDAIERDLATWEDVRQLERELTAATARIAELEAQLAAAQKDAQRYQWLRTFAGHKIYAVEAFEDDTTMTFDTSLDEAIDAAQSGGLGETRCQTKKMGEYDMLRCCRKSGHVGEHNYVIDTAQGGEGE